MTYDTLNRVDYSKYDDGPDTLPIGTSRGTSRANMAGLPDTLRAHDKPVDFFEVDADMELFRMRTKAHLYEPWMTEAIHNERAKRVRMINRHLVSLGQPADVYDWDCHKCESAVVTRGFGPCPKCKS